MPDTEYEELVPGLPIPRLKVLQGPVELRPKLTETDGLSPPVLVTVPPKTAETMLLFTDVEGVLVAMTAVVPA